MMIVIMIVTVFRLKSLKCHGISTRPNAGVVLVCDVMEKIGLGA